MVVRNANIHNIMGGMESTGGVRLHNHRRKLKQRFDIIRKLGQGTYGKVQLGINKETGQEVAIKTIKKAKIETEADLIRIRREIQIMSSVQHPNIIHIYEVFENREKMVLVMEYAAGGELYDYLSERKILPQDEARRIFRQIATAVFYCHKHKICHRDLKLENILLDEHGSAKIADFGLSNVFDEQRLLNTFCGSPLYASPEIVKGTPYHGPEVDCWSLGVLLYTLVYGAMPFDGSNFKRLVKQISQGDYFEPKKPSPASSLIREMLTVPPARRADIEKVCSHWWVNEGYSDSCLQIAEELADQTPVRLDLLLSLAPPPTGVGTDSIMQQGMNSAATAPHLMMPTRCHSVGSLMELDHSTVDQPQTFENQSVYDDSGAASAEATFCAPGGHWDSAKRKLEQGASSSEVNLRGTVKRDRGKRRTLEGNANIQLLATRMDERVCSENSREEEMDAEDIPNLTHSSISHAMEHTESMIPSKGSEVETQVSEVGSLCKSSTESSTPTVVPTENLSTAALSITEEQCPAKPIGIDNTNQCISRKNSARKSTKKKYESGGDKHIREVSKASDNSKSEVGEEQELAHLKEYQKEIAIEKHEKPQSDEINAEAGDFPIFLLEEESKTKEFTANGKKSNNVTTGVKHDISSNTQKSSTKSAKNKGGLLRENCKSNSEIMHASESLESSTPLGITAERRRSKIFETADRFNNISSSTDTKGAQRDKPKKLFIPGVKVSDAKKVFERKLSNPEISVSSFSKKYPTKSDLLFEKSGKGTSDKSEDNDTVKQRVISHASENFICASNVKNSGKTKLPPRELEDEATNTETSTSNKCIGETVADVTPRSMEEQSENKSKKSKNFGKMCKQILGDDNKTECLLDSSKAKTTKSAELKKHAKSVISKALSSASEGIPIKENIESRSNLHGLNVSNESDVHANSENNETQKMLQNEKEGNPISTRPKTNEETAKLSIRPSDSAGKKKSSKVEITLKSATLPRRKTSKAEIKLDTTIPPIEYKTEVEHMVSAPVMATHTAQSNEEHGMTKTAQPFRSWSLEPEGTLHNKVSTRECIIPIRIEQEAKENANFTCPPVGRPPAYPFQQRSVSQTQRSGTLSRQSTQESDSDVGMEPIRKSPREYIIPIAVEGGGYVTPHTERLESLTSDGDKSRQKYSASAQLSQNRRMSSLLSDTSEDEGFNVSPVGLQRHGSLTRGRDDGRTFNFHRLRSSRPMRHSLEHNDSFSSAEEDDDDDDDDDEGFEILTAESLFSTLLSRVRSLTQRLTVEDGKRTGFPSHNFINQLTNISQPSTSWKSFYGHRREPLSRRLSETSSFPRLLNRGGEFGQRSSRESSNCDSVGSEGSCTVGTFPRGLGNKKPNPYNTTRRGVRNFPSSLHCTPGALRKGGWSMKHDEMGDFNSSVRICSSSERNISKSLSHSNQNHYLHTSRKLSRTLSLMSAAEERQLNNCPSENNMISIHPANVFSEQHTQNIVLHSPTDYMTSPSMSCTNRGSPKSRSPLKSSTLESQNPKPKECASRSILPPLPQTAVLKSKFNNVSRPICNIDKIQAQKSNNYQHHANKILANNCQRQPKHSLSLPSIDQRGKVEKNKEKHEKPMLTWSKTESQRETGSAGAASGTDLKDGNEPTNNSRRSVNESLIGEISKSNTGSCLGSDKKQELLNKISGKSAENLKEASSQETITGISETELTQNEYQKGNSTFEKCSTVDRSLSKSKFDKIHSNIFAEYSSDKDDVTTTQKRRISRFLRPDFYDTPPEESSYVKEREAKKAAEAEVKKARRLAQRASSMRELSSKTDDNSKTRYSVGCKLSKNSIRNKIEEINSVHPSVSTVPIEMEHSEKISSKPLSAFLSHSEDKINIQCWSPPTHKEVAPKTSSNGFCSSADSRVSKAISSLQGHNSIPWDRKVVATESTYLKRAVSVDDICLKNQKLLTKSNTKIGRKISSVLGLFSKMENSLLDNRHSSRISQAPIFENIGKAISEHESRQCEHETYNNEKVSSNKLETKLKESKLPVDASTIPNESDDNSIKIKQSNVLKDKPKHSKKNIAVGISDTKCVKELSKRLSSVKDLIENQQLPRETPQNKNCDSLSMEIVQMSASSNTDKPLQDHLHPTIKRHTETQVEKAVCLMPDREIYSSSCLLPCNAPNLTTSKDIICFPETINNGTENPPADESESIDSWCACSDIDIQENLSLLALDDDDKDIETVEDRIRRKSFYSRFNDVKKKGRKKSSQFLKDRTSLLPSNYYHKNNDILPILPQNNEMGYLNRKSPVPSIPAESHCTFAAMNTQTLPDSQHNLPIETNKFDGPCSVEGNKKKRSPSKEKLLNISTSKSDIDIINTCTLKRPAAFAHGVLKNISPQKVKSPTQPQEENTVVPESCEPVLGTTSPVTSNDNISQCKDAFIF